MCGPAPRSRTELLLEDLTERVKELVNEVRRLKDIVEPPDLPPVKVSTVQYHDRG